MLAVRWVWGVAGSGELQVPPPACHGAQGAGDISSQLPRERVEGLPGAGGSSLRLAGLGSGQQNPETQSCATLLPELPRRPG